MCPMGRVGLARHVFWRAMRANVPGRAGPVKDLGRAVPCQSKKKNRWPSTAHKPVDYSCRAVPCRAVLVGRANWSCQWVVPVGRVSGPWAMIVGSYFFKKY